jgi:hypothetical protein
VALTFLIVVNKGLLMIIKSRKVTSQMDQVWTKAIYISVDGEIQQAEPSIRHLTPIHASLCALERFILYNSSTNRCVDYSSHIEMV